MTKAVKEKRKKKKNPVDSSDLVLVGEGGEGGKNETQDNNNENDGLRRDVIALRSKADQSYWDLAIALSEVYNNGYYQAWGFDSWKEYVEIEVDIHVRKAQFLVKLQEWFVTMTPGIQKWMQELGWTKARMLMHVVTKENAKEWKAKVKGKSVVEIEAMIKGLKEAELDEDGDGEVTSGADVAEQSFKMSFQVFEQQKETVDLALSKAGEVAESDKAGHLLTLICTDYLATNAGVDSLDGTLKNLEMVLGISLIAIDKSDNILYGEEHITES